MNDTRGGAFTGISREPHGPASTLASIARDARLTRGYVLQIVLSTAIAHLGLLMNSAPVIIGAMLISPLLAPVMGFGFALATLDGRLLRRSLQTLAVGTAAAIAVAAVLTLLSPMTDATPSILARVRPSLLDLMVAIFGGVAGAYALLRRFSATLVGVAIATALIPPLATVGWALVLGRFDNAAGALLLYVTNTAAIGFMATAVARFNGFGRDLSPQQTGIQTIGIAAALAVLAIPLGVSLSAIVREAQATAVLRDKLVGMTGDGATLDRFEIDFGAEEPEVSAVVISPLFTPELEKRFATVARRELGRGTRTRIIQLRSGSPEADQSRSKAADVPDGDSIEQREMQRLRAALAAAFRVNPNAILIDPERREAAVRIPPAPNLPAPSSPGSIERAAPDTAPLRAAFPDWTIVTVFPARPTPTVDNGGENGAAEPASGDMPDG